MSDFAYRRIQVYWAAASLRPPKCHHILHRRLKLHDVELGNSFRDPRVPFRYALMIGNGHRATLPTGMLSQGSPSQRHIARCIHAVTNKVCRFSPRSRSKACLSEL